MDLHLTSKHFLITGGTRGIGRAVAMGFAAEGADVSICARDEAAVEETVATLRSMGVRAFGRALDVADAGALAAFVQEAHAALLQQILQFGQHCRQLCVLSGSGWLSGKKATTSAKLTKLRHMAA